MKEAGLYFIGNVKQCSRRFPMEVLGNATLPKRGLVFQIINNEKYCFPIKDFLTFFH
jgi:hypothetical protein